MYEHILRHEKYLYRVYLNADGILKLDQAEQGKIISSCTLSQQPITEYSADINGEGLHVLAYTSQKLLIYINYQPDGHITGANLARINSSEQDILHPLICANDGGLKIYYTVADGENYSLVEYTKSSSWKGRRLYNSPCPLTLLVHNKYTGKVYFEEQNTDCTLYEYSSAVKKLLTSKDNFSSLQFVSNSLLYESEGKLYLDGEYLFEGEAPCVYHIEGDKYILYCLSDGQLCRSDFNSNRSFSPPLPSYSMSQWRIYKYTHLKQNCFLLSTPFPKITLPISQAPLLSKEAHEIGETAQLISRIKHLEEDVYLHKRALFALEAEVRALKNSSRH